jgi:23S rRNA (uracil1939-C5)-methyltransferase
MKGKAIDYTHDGRGVVKNNSFPIFVPNLMIGEEAEIDIVKEGKSYHLGRVSKRLSDSQDRVTAPCPYYHVCGGCQLQHMNYEAQLNMKQKRVEDALKHIAGLYVKVLPIKGMKTPWHYRNKVQMAFENGTKGLIAGFYKEKTRKVIDIKSCLIEDASGDDIVNTLKSLMNEEGIKAYDAISKQGFIRHIIVRKGFVTKEIMVVIIGGKKDFPKQAIIINKLLEKHQDITTIVFQHQPDDTNIVKGEQVAVLYGNGYIEDVIAGLTFRIGASSFFQVNPIQTEVLYEEAMSRAKITKNDIVLDAYCGVGTLSLMAAKYAKQVVGVEIVKEAIDHARTNQQLNQMNNVTFIKEDATKYMTKDNIPKFDVVLVDPPRDGLQTPFIEVLKTMQPKKIVYVSCEPSSLARDLKQLKSMYQIESVQPVDMFSQTYHVETVVLLSLK